MRATSPEGFYIFMLYEDLDHVVPYTIGRHGGQQARVTGPDADKARPLIERALSGQEWTRSLSDSVRKFVSSTAQYVVISGPVTYEIDYLYPLADAAAPPTEFRLELVRPGTLAHHGRQPIQYIPDAYGGPKDKTGLTYADLDPATLVTFRLPPAEEAAVRKVVRFLRAANSLQGAETPLIQQSGRGGTAYSFAEHQRQRAQRSPGRTVCRRGRHLSACPGTRPRVPWWRTTCSARGPRPPSGPGTGRGRCR